MCLCGTARCRRVQVRRCCLLPPPHHTLPAPCFPHPPCTDCAQHEGARPGADWLRVAPAGDVQGCHLLLGRIHQAPGLRRAGTPNAAAAAVAAAGAVTGGGHASRGASRAPPVAHRTPHQCLPAVFPALPSPRSPVTRWAVHTLCYHRTQWHRRGVSCSQPATLSWRCCYTGAAAAHRAGPSLSA